MRKQLCAQLAIICLFLTVVFACEKDKNQEPKEPVTEARLGDTVRVSFPKGSIAATQVSLKTVDDKASAEIFNETASFYRMGKTLPYQIVLNIGSEAPLNDSISIVVKLPQSFKSSLPVKYGFQIFAQAYQESSFEIIDNFYQIFSSYNPTTGEVAASLPRELFTNQRTADKSYEAILIIGTTPGENLPFNALKKNTEIRTVQSSQKNIEAKECDASQISCPLGSFEKCDEFISREDLFGPRLDPLGKKVIKNHRGVDYRVGTGTPIYAVADGKIEISRFSSTYGNIIFVRHKDNTGTLYAHLSEQSVPEGQSVKKGQVIGKTGATGARVTGAHLHFEYYSEGEKYAQNGQIDPFPCVSEGNVDGNITVRDNGSAADDAFEIYLDGSFLGATQIGQSNSVAASGLKSGNKTLTLKCTIAPDNLGTYEVILNNGLTFSSGGVRQEGTMGQGQSTNWQIIIPQKQNTTNNLFLRRLNSVKEN